MARALISVMLKKGFEGGIVLVSIGLNRIGRHFTSELSRAFKFLMSFVSLQEGEHGLWSFLSPFDSRILFQGNTSNETHSGKLSVWPALAFLMAPLSVC